MVIALPEDEPIRVYVTLVPLLTGKSFSLTLLVKSIIPLLSEVVCRRREFLGTYLSDDSEESYRSVQRFFRNESAKSSSPIDWFEPEGLSTGGWVAAPVTGVIETSFSWSEPFVCFDVVCMFDALSSFSLRAHIQLWSLVWSDGNKGWDGKVVFLFGHFPVRSPSYVFVCVWSRLWLNCHKRNHNWFSSLLVLRLI